MSILRKNNKSRYTTIPQDIILDSRLAPDDLGLLIIILSLPHTSIFTAKSLYKILDNKAKAYINRCLNHLEELGYINRIQIIHNTTIITPGVGVISEFTHDPPDSDPEPAYKLNNNIHPMGKRWVTNKENMKGR